MKRGTPEHPKVAKLAKALSIPSYGAVGLLELLWHFTARYAIQGDIGKWSDQEITIACQWSGEANEFIQALISCQWIDEDAEHRLLVHDWEDHRDDSVRKTLLNRKIAVFRPTQSNPSGDSVGIVPTSPGKARQGKAAGKRPKVTFADGKFHVPPELMKTWSKAYPMFAVEPEIRKAEAWYLANPERQKKQHGRFLNNWLSNVKPSQFTAAPSSTSYKDVGTHHE